MDGRVGHLRCQVRRRAGAPPLALERLARERVAVSLAGALETIAGGDPAVHVLRHVRVGLAVTGAPDEAMLGRRWSDGIAAAVARSLAGPEGEDRIRFSDQAEFVARFIDELVAGSAWERWYFGAFAGLRGLETDEALRRVLLEHRDLLPSILAWLERIGALERVLGALGDGTARLLLAPSAEPEAVEPLLAAALRLLAALGRLDAARADRQALLAAYLARRPAPVRWSDRRELARGVLDAVRFLAACGLVERAAHAPVLPDDVRAELAWLDVAWLAERLEAALDEAAPSRTSVPSARRGALTPLQRRVVAELSAVLAAEPSGRAESIDAPANVLRLTAAVAARGVGASEALPSVVARVLGAAARALSAPAGEELALLLARGERDAALALLAASGLAPLDALLVAELGPAAAALCAAPAFEPAPWACGLLLARAAFDLRLPLLCASTGFPDQGGFGALLGALCLHWSATDPDPSLALLTASPTSPPPATAPAFEAALAAVLSAHGLAGAATGDTPLARTATAVLRAWARWLRGFGEASEDFLLRELVRRDAAVGLDGEVLRVRLAARPLDVVLDLAGYFEPLDARASLGVRIAFEVTP